MSFPELCDLARARGWAVGLALERRGDGKKVRYEETLSVYDGRPIRAARVLARANLGDPRGREIDRVAASILERLRAGP